MSVGQSIPAIGADSLTHQVFSVLKKVTEPNRRRSARNPSGMEYLLSQKLLHTSDEDTSLIDHVLQLHPEASTRASTEGVASRYHHSASSCTSTSCAELPCTQPFMRAAPIPRTTTMECTTHSTHEDRSCASPTANGSSPCLAGESAIIDDDFLGGTTERYELGHIGDRPMPRWIRKRSRQSRSVRVDGTTDSNTVDLPRMERLPREDGVGRSVAHISPDSPAQPRVTWSTDDIMQFNMYLQQFGTDFSLLQHFLPHRSRADLRRFFLNQRKWDPDLTSYLLSHRKEHFSWDFVQNVVRGYEP